MISIIEGIEVDSDNLKSEVIRTYYIHLIKEKVKKVKRLKKLQCGNIQEVSNIQGRSVMVGAIGTINAKIKTLKKDPYINATIPLWENEYLEKEIGYLESEHFADNYEYKATSLSALGGASAKEKNEFYLKINIEKEEV